MSNEIGGPYVQVGTICERALQEKDGVVSLVRVVDRFTVTLPGPPTPDRTPASTIGVTIVVMLKSGIYRGTGNLKIVPVAPSGQKLRELSVAVFLEGEDRGVNVILNAQFVVQEEGIYWLDVSFQDQLLTRIPMRILYQWVTPLPMTPAG